MNFTKRSFLKVWIDLAICALAVGCVDIPDTGHFPPDYQAQVRIIYLDPALGVATISVAAGPSFATYTDLPPGMFGTATPYMALPAGGKRLVLKVGGVPVDPDSGSETFGTDERGTLFVFPRPAIDSVRYDFISERNTFQTGGIRDTTLIRFVNAIAGDSIVVTVRRIFVVDTVVTDIPVVHNLSLGRISGRVSVPTGQTANFYMTRSPSPSAILTDTISVIGSSNRVLTIVAFDSIGAGRVQFVSFENN